MWWHTCSLELARTGDALNTIQFLRRLSLHWGHQIDQQQLGTGVSVWVAWLGIRMSTHKHTSPIFFGITISGETHGVGPSNLLNDSLLLKLLELCWDFLEWNGILQADWAPGGRVLSMCNFITVFQLPHPLEHTQILLNQIWTWRDIVDLDVH